jgi:hypothetical protein
MNIQEALSERCHEHPRGLLDVQFITLLFGPARGTPLWPCTRAKEHEAKGSRSRPSAGARPAARRSTARPRRWAQPARGAPQARLGRRWRPGAPREGPRGRLRRRHRAAREGRIPGRRGSTQPSLRATRHGTPAPPPKKARAVRRARGGWAPARGAAGAAGGALRAQGASGAGRTWRSPPGWAASSTVEQTTSITSETTQVAGSCTHCGVSRRAGGARAARGRGAGVGGGAAGARLFSLHVERQPPRGRTRLAGGRGRKVEEPEVLRGGVDPGDPRVEQAAVRAEHLKGSAGIRYQIGLQALQTRTCPCSSWRRAAPRSAGSRPCRTASRSASRRASRRSSRRAEGTRTTASSCHPQPRTPWHTAEELVFQCRGPAEGAGWLFPGAWARAESHGPGAWQPAVPSTAGPFLARATDRKGGSVPGVHDRTQRERSWTTRCRPLARSGPSRP